MLLDDTKRKRRNARVSDVRKTRKRERVREEGERTEEALTVGKHHRIRHFLSPSLTGLPHRAGRDNSIQLAA